MSETMNLTNKLNQEFVINKLIESDWESGNSGPLVIELDPTAVCDLACPGCISEDLVAIGKADGNFDEAEKAYVEMIATTLGIDEAWVDSLLNN